VRKHTGSGTTTTQLLPKELINVEQALKILAGAQLKPDMMFLIASINKLFL
jgi:hypothetical protein